MEERYHKVNEEYGELIYFFNFGTSPGTLFLYFRFFSTWGGVFWRQRYYTDLVKICFVEPQTEPLSSGLDSITSSLTHWTTPPPQVKNYCLGQCFPTSVLGNLTFVIWKFEVPLEVMQSFWKTNVNFFIVLNIFS